MEIIETSEKHHKKTILIGELNELVSFLKKKFCTNASIIDLKNGQHQIVINGHVKNKLIAIGSCEAVQ